MFDKTLFHSLNSRILLISTGAACALIGVTLSSIIQDRVKSINTLEINSINLARTMAEHAARTLDAVDLTLRNIKSQAERDRSSTQRAEKEIITEFEDYIASYPQIRGLILTDKNGIIRYTERKKSMGMDVHDRTYFLAHKNQSDLEFYIGKPLKGRTTGRWFFSTSRKIVDNKGNFDGIAMALVTQDYFAKIYEKTENEQNVSLAYTSTTGAIFAASPGVTDDRSDVAGKIMDLKIDNPESGSYSGSIFSGSAPRIISYVSVPNMPIYIVASISIDRGLASWRERTMNLVLLVCTALFLLSWLTFFACRQVMKRETFETRLSEILEIAPEAVISTDEDMNILLYNKSAERIFGYQADEVIGRPMEMLIPSRQRMVHKEHVVMFRDSPLSFREMVSRDEVSGLRKDGTEFPATASVSKIKKGEKTVFTVMMQDISRRKKAEDALRKAHDELENKVQERTKELKIAKDKAETADTAKSQLVTTMSHELRTPLTSIVGSLRLLQEKNLIESNEQRADLLEMAWRNSTQLAKLVDDIINVERLEVGAMSINKQPMNMAKLVQKSAELNAGYAAEKDVVIVVNDSEYGIMVLGDEVRLLQVMANLLSNAAKFSPKNGEITTLVKQVNGTVMVSVSDNGPGIPDDIRGTIFEKFVRGENIDSRSTGGAGLGLNITKAIVEKHGGVIGFESELGEGTTFFFTLPATE